MAGDSDPDVKVRAKARGQKPNGVWVLPGAEFTVPESMVGRWMEPLDGGEGASAKSNPDGLNAGNTPASAPSGTMDRDTAIKEAMIGLPDGEFTKSGKPEVDALNDALDLDPRVDAEERDRLWAELNDD